MKTLTVSTAITAALAVAALTPACAFVEDATQIVLGAESGLPLVEASATLEASQVNEALLAAMATTAEGVAVEQLSPWLLDPDDTWLDLRSTLCELARLELLPWPAIEVDMTPDPGLVTAKVQHVTMKLEVPLKAAGDFAACMQMGLEGKLRVEFSPFAVDDARKIERLLGNNLSILADAVVQIRFLIGKIDFLRQRGAEREVANSILSDFHLAIVEPDIIDDPRTPYPDGWLELVPFFLLETITETAPQRFELDPDSPVTERIGRLLLTPPDTWASQTITVEALATISPKQLAQTPVAGSGIELWAQPEVVIDGLTVLESRL